MPEQPTTLPKQTECFSTRPPPRPLSPFFSTLSNKKSSSSSSTAPNSKSIAFTY